MRACVIPKVSGIAIKEELVSQAHVSRLQCEARQTLRHYYLLNRGMNHVCEYCLAGQVQRTA